MARTALAVIPARYASRRFPGKPLADIDGAPLVVRVARRALAARRVQGVVVATDDARIAAAAEKAGIEAAMTSPEHASGSDRVAEVIRGLRPAPELVLDVQGDQPLVDPADLDALVDAARDDGITTLARPLPDPARIGDPNWVKVVTTKDGRALYFSRAPIPHAMGGAGPAARLHVGIYAYPPAVLARFAALVPSPLEVCERLEQLRALENGIPIHVTMCVSVRPSIGVDVPGDIEAVVRALRNEEQG